MRKRLDEMADWRLSDEDWAEVEVVIARLHQAIDDRDGNGVADSHAQLSGFDPDFDGDSRRVIRARLGGESTPAVRERLNTLVHAIDAQLAEDDSPLAPRAPSGKPSEET
jgi:hypothetical protein